MCNASERLKLAFWEMLYMSTYDKVHAIAKQVGVSNSSSQ